MAFDSTARNWAPTRRGRVHAGRQAAGIRPPLTPSLTRAAAIELATA